MQLLVRSSAKLSLLYFMIWTLEWGLFHSSVMRNEQVTMMNVVHFLEQIHSSKHSKLQIFFFITAAEIVLVFYKLYLWLSYDTYYYISCTGNMYIGSKLLK